MTLSDFGVVVCEGNACRVDFSRYPVSEGEIAALQRAWMLRGRRGMDQGDESFWRARVEPLAVRMGVEPGLLLIGPMLWGWP
jgi:hypothetical protein